ncbi:MAG: RidA family protein [Acidimicrobiales bacterium]
MDPAATNASERLVALGISLPTPPRPLASYVTAVRAGDLLFTSGHGPVAADGSITTGKVGIDLDVAAGQAAARLTAINLLATVHAELGSLDRVARVVKVFGMVNCPPTFTEHPAVLNGCSDLLVDVFGEAGRHVRSAVGVSSLPLNFAVEIEMVLQVR